MAILQNEKLKYYHPCNTMIDSSGVAWVHGALTSYVGLTQFIPGKVGNGIEYSGGGEFSSISDILFEIGHQTMATHWHPSTWNHRIR